VTCPFRERWNPASGCSNISSIILASDRIEGKRVDKFFDKYAWQARRFPALIVLLPIALAAVAWDPKIEDALKPLLGIVVSTGILVLLVQFARDAGKRAEGQLVKTWGAMPSVLMLRHGDTRIDSVTKRRYHAALQKLISGIRMPNAAAEAADPAAADQVYESCCNYLRTQTRDETKFPLVLAENINYGFRRNLFGLKAWGIVSSVAGLVGCTAKVVIDYRGESAPSVLTWICLAGCTLLLLTWLFLINSVWIRQVADTYALRLLEAIDQLQPDKTK